MSERLPIVVAVNRDAILSGNLLRSPDVLTGSAFVIEERGHASAGAAYNAGLRRAGSAKVVALVHQDVYLPKGWVGTVHDAINKLDEQSWGVAGVWGVRADGQYVGRVWCSGGRREHVGLVGTDEVSSLDEIVLLLNSRHNLKFDSDLPGFHLYATDVILRARQKGLKAFCLDAPVVHNSRCNPQPLDRAYRAAYRYMQQKWEDELPVQTCVVDVTPLGWPMYRQWVRNEVARARGKLRAAPPEPDPAAIAQRLGYEPAVG